MTYQPDKTIFVQIVSYLDSECKNTIDDLYSKALYPNRISTGVNWQYDEEVDDIPFYPKKYKDNIRLISFGYKESQGVCWARSQVQKLYRDELYTLSIDAHMRFVDHWDTKLVDMLENLQKKGHKKPVITHYPPDYTLEGEYGDTVKKMAPFLQEKDRIFIFKRSGHTLEPGSGPVLSACFAGGFNFTLGASIKEVPYDPYLYFFGEEITMAARLWTHGYDFFNPGEIAAYHLYKRSVKTSGEIKKNRHIKVHQVEKGAKQKNHFAKQRVKHLLGTAFIQDEKITKGLELHGLGEERTLYQYEIFSGINFKKLTRSVHSRTAILNKESIPLGRLKEKEEAKKNELGAEAIFFDKKMEEFLSVIGVKSISHILAGRTPCVDNFGIQYVGINYRKELTDLNNRYYLSNKKIFFLNSAVSSSPIPYSDISIINIADTNTDKYFIWQTISNMISSNSTFISVISKNNIFENKPFFFCEPFIVKPYKDWLLIIWKKNDLIHYKNAVSSEIGSLKKDLYRNIERELSKISTNSTKTIISKVIPEQSFSEVKNRLLSEETKRAHEIDTETSQIIENIINLRFRRINNKTRTIYPMIDKSNSLIAMTLLCEYFENLAQTPYS